MEIRYTPEELETLEAYEKLAEERIKTHQNPEFWRPQFEKFQNLLPAGRILDVGCGTGRDAILFTQAGYDYVGIDLSDKMLEQARRSVPRAMFRKMSMYSLDFPFHSFDGFWASASLLHVPKKNLGIVLAEIRKVVKPGGIGFFAMKEGEGEKMIRGKLPGDERFFAFYQERELLAALEKAGFRVLEHSRDLRQYSPPQNLTVWLLCFVRV